MRQYFHVVLFLSQLHFVCHKPVDILNEIRVSKGAIIKFHWQIAQNVHEVVLRRNMRFS